VPALPAHILRLLVLATYGHLSALPSSHWERQVARSGAQGGKDPEALAVR